VVVRGWIDEKDALQEFRKKVPMYSVKSIDNEGDQGE
jgi:hypothetical protein